MEDKTIVAVSPISDPALGSRENNNEAGEELIGSDETEIEDCVSLREGFESPTTSDKQQESLAASYHSPLLETNKPPRDLNLNDCDYKHSMQQPQRRQESDPLLSDGNDNFQLSLRDSSLTNMKTSSTQLRSRHHHSIPGRETYRQPVLGGHYENAAFNNTMPEAEETLETDERRGSSSGKSSRVLFSTKDALIRTLSEQILHQQRSLQEQESRLYLQEQRLAQLERGLRSLNLQPEWKQQQRSDLHPTAYSTGYLVPSLPEEIPHAQFANAMPASFPISGSTDTKWYERIADELFPRNGGQANGCDSMPTSVGQFGTTGAPQQLGRICTDVVQMRSDHGAGRAPQNTRKKAPFCCS